MTPETSIYEFAKQGLEKFPDKTALWFYGRSISYRELFGRIDCAAEQLAGLGVGRNTVVTVRLSNCPQTIIAVYAIAKLGGICNMVHALLPAESLKSDMTFTESRILITGNHISDGDSIEFADKLLYVDISRDMGHLSRIGYKLLNGRRYPARAIPFEQDVQRTVREYPFPESLSDVCGVYMHSSGSTGEPKTVMLSHVALNNWVEITRVYFRGTDISKQICLSALPYFHALGFQMDMHRVISCGGTLVLMARWNARQAVKFIKRHRITVLAGVPAMCRSLMAQKDFSGDRIYQLRGCFIGGEKMDRSLKVAMDERLNAGDVPCVYEGYGLTETASACAVLEKDHYHIDASGYPQYGITCMVLTETGELLEEGEGEIVIGGNCLMMGYLKDPVATEQAFIYRKGQRLLRTGDYGRVDQNGLIYIKDRIKNTIVRNGNNIFPIEVESVIRSVEGVSDVCVIGLPDAERGTQLVCACIVSDGRKKEEEIKERIESECKRILPPVSIPTRYVFLEELPKNHVGKIDRKILEHMTL